MGNQDRRKNVLYLVSELKNLEAQYGKPKTTVNAIDAEFTIRRARSKTTGDLRMKKTTSKHVKGTTVTLEVLDHFKESLWELLKKRFYSFIWEEQGSGKSHAICQRIFVAMFMEMEDTQFAIVRGNYACT